MVFKDLHRQIFNPFNSERVEVLSLMENELYSYLEEKLCLTLTFSR